MRLRTVVFVSLMFSGTQLHAAIISVVPPTQNAVVGDTVAVDLVASGLTAGGPPSLGAFDIDILYDPNILSVLAASFGVPGYLDLGVSGSIQSWDLSVPGVIRLSEVSLSLRATSMHRSRHSSP